MWEKHLASGGVAPERQSIESTVTTRRINSFGVRSPIEMESRQAAHGERSPVSGCVSPASMWFSPRRASTCSFGGRDSACGRTPSTALLMRMCLRVGCPAQACFKRRWVQLGICTWPVNGSFMSAFRGGAETCGENRVGYRMLAASRTRPSSNKANLLMHWTSCTLMNSNQRRACVTRYWHSGCVVAQHRQGTSTSRSERLKPPSSSSWECVQTCPLIVTGPWWVHCRRQLTASCSQRS